jgi:hypothetical protein
MSKTSTLTICNSGGRSAIFAQKLKRRIIVYMPLILITLKGTPQVALNCLCWACCWLQLDMCRPFFMQSTWHIWYPSWIETYLLDTTSWPGNIYVHRSCQPWPYAYMYWAVSACRPLYEQENLLPAITVNQSGQAIAGNFLPEWIFSTSLIKIAYNSVRDMLHYVMWIPEICHIMWHNSLIF